MLQPVPALHKMLGAQRTRDPTTSGDFLRRFEAPSKLEALHGAVNEPGAGLERAAALEVAEASALG